MMFSLIIAEVFVKWVCNFSGNSKIKKKAFKKQIQHFESFNLLPRCMSSTTLGAIQPVRFDNFSSSTKDLQLANCKPSENATANARKT